MISTKTKDALRTLTIRGLEAIASSSFGMEGFKGAIAYFDPRKDELVTKLPEYEPAVGSLRDLSEVQTLFGADEAARLTLQFVFNAYEKVKDGASPQAAFDHVWESLLAELTTPTWTFAAVANVQNLNCPDGNQELFDGVSIRGRSFEELSTLLHWGPRELDFLIKDWMDTAGSSYVLLYIQRVPKTPDNFLLANDGTAYDHVARALLALRLLGPGDIRIGRIFFARPANFNVGIGGMTSAGFAAWNPGSPYELTSNMIPSVNQLAEQLKLLARGKNGVRNLNLALRSFSSIYDRFLHQAEDRVLDAITALEAIWKLEAELAFRLSFRTASLLGESDDNRASLYETVRKYYGIRSKIVHGEALRETESSLVIKDETIRNIVRRTLRAFVQLANKPGEWTLDRLYKEADTALLHNVLRQSLRVAMGLQQPE